MIFWKKSLGLARLAIITNMEYRVNFFADVFLQPVVTALIELTLWVSIFSVHGGGDIAGFGKDYYLSYAIWGAFVARITVNWMYEFRMLEEIETGKINSILVRPVSYYYYYLVQFLSYKGLTTAFSLLIPLSLMYFLKLPFQLDRFFLSLFLIGYFLILVHTMSFCVSCLGFYINRAHSFTVAKNLFFWILSGELFPLDMLPGFLKEVFLSLPFCSAVYIPVGFITGRFGYDVFFQGFISVTYGLIFFGALAYFLWASAIKKYSGTGA